MADIQNIQVEQTARINLPVDAIQQIIEMTIEKVNSKNPMSTIEHFNATRKEVSVPDITSILRGENKFKGNGSETVKKFLDGLVVQKKLIAINAATHANLFRMSDIYDLFHKGEFDNI